MEFYGNKWVKALPQFPYFRNLSVLLTVQVLLKLQFTEKEKETLSVVAEFFSNAAWFAISIKWTKQNRTFYI